VLKVTLSSRYVHGRLKVRPHLPLNSSRSPVGMVMISDVGALVTMNGFAKLFILFSVCSKFSFDSNPLIPSDRAVLTTTDLSSEHQIKRLVISESFFRIACRFASCFTKLKKHTAWSCSTHI
jgi:hypothetical protein